MPVSEKRGHVVTLAGALETYTLDYRKLLHATRRLTQDHAQVAEAVRRMIFNVRAANAGDHGKNHAFMLDPDTAEWRLAPAYDLTLNADPLVQYHGLSVSTFGVSPSIELMRGVAADYGVTADEFALVDEAVARAISSWPDFAGEAGIPKPVRQKISGIHASINGILEASLRGKDRRPGRRKLWE